MRVGQIISLPPGESNFAQVRDEYGGTWSVDRSELPEDVEDGDDYAYRVDFYSRKGNATLKQRDE